MGLRFSPTRGSASLVLNAMTRGPVGAAATISVGTVTPLTPGATPTVSNTGSTAAAVLAFGIPTSKTVAVGTTTTGAEGTNAAVSDSGTSSASIFDFTIPRGAAPAIGYTFSTTTTDSDPGAGNLRFNNATPASVTEIYFDNADADGNTVTSWLDSFDDSTTSGHKGHLVFTDVASPSTKIIFEATGASVVDGTGYRKVTVVWVSGAALFTNARRLAVQFSRTGDKGADGAVAGPGTTVDGEIVLYNGTSGNSLKRASITGLVKAAAGVAALAVAGTDYYNPGGTDVAVADGGTGASTAAGARTNLGSTAVGDAVFIAASAAAALTALTARGQGKETVWIPASAMIARTTNGAGSGTAEMTTNKNMVKTLDFDTSTQEFAQFEVAFPKSFNNGTVTFQPVWSHAATTTNFGVVWALAGVATSDDDALDVAFGTAQTSTDTGGTTNDRYIGPESSAITIAGSPATGDVVQFQIARNVSDGSDTMAIDARLHGIKLYFTTNAATDA